MKETFSVHRAAAAFLLQQLNIFSFFQIKLETVPAAMNIVIETTVSWRGGCIGFYHHRDWGALGPGRP